MSSYVTPQLVQAGCSNVEGILKMQQGRYQEAISCFNHGLTPCVTSQVDSENWDSGEIASLGQLTEHGKKTSGQTRQGAFLRSVSVAHGSSDVHDDVFKLFDRALHFPADAVSQAKNSGFYLVVLSGIMAFNMGLANHLEGLLKGDSKRLNRAFELYSIAYTTLSDHNNRCESLDLGLLAACNNMGHVLAFFRCFTETSVCSDDLSHRLFTLTGGFTHDRAAQAYFLDEEYKVFVLNACFFRAATLVAAPSA